MSKKIAKRSLALGALMAFVITGSAMAAATDMQLDQITDDLTITGQDLVVTTNGTSVYNKDVKVISDSDITINAIDEGILAHGKVTIDAKNVNIEAGDNGIKASSEKEDGSDSSDSSNLLDYSQVTINTKENVNIASEGEGYAITNVGGEIDITAGGNVSLTSDNRPAVRVVREDADSVILNVTGKNITVKGFAHKHDEGEFEATAIYAQTKGAVLNLTATDTIKISDVEKVGGSAVAAYDGGVVNIKDAANVVIDGKVYTKGEGSKITFDAVENVTISSTQGSAINNASKGIVIVGDENTKTIKITGVAQDLYSVYDNNGQNLINYNEDNRAVIFAQGTVNITATDQVEITESKNQKAIAAYGGANVIIDGGQKTVINGEINADGHKYAVQSNGNIEHKDNNIADNINILIKGKEVTITGDSSDTQEGVYARGDSSGIDNAVITIGDANTKKVAINYTDNGLVALNGGSTIEVNSESLVISASGNNEDNVSGISADNESAVGDKFASVYVNVSKTEIIAQDDGFVCAGIAANGKSKVNVTGDLDIIAKGYSAYGVEAVNGSTVNLGNANATVNFNITGALTDTDSDANSSPEAQAISAEGGSTVNVTANELTIKTKGLDMGSLQSHGSGSSIKVTANKATIGGVMYADEGSTLDISGIKELTLTGLVNNNTIPAIQVAEGGTLKVNTNGTLAIDGAAVGNTYNVVSGVADEKVLWAKENIAYDRTEMFATTAIDVNKMYSVTYKAAEQLTETEKAEAQKEYVAATGGSELAVPGLVGSTVGQGATMDKTAPAAKDFLAQVSKDDKMTKETKAAVINSAAQLAEAGGNSSTAVNVAGNVSGATTGRLSFNGGGHGGGHKGGHGVGLFEEGSGAAIWAQYLHGKDKGEDVPMEGGVSNYESNYDGIVLGVDFKKVGKYQSGMAFNYGEGDSNGYTSAATTQSDYDFWGIGYYGNIRNEDTNFIFDVNYAQSESDVTQHNLGSKDPIEASPETTTWTAGVKAEKLYQNNNVQIVPYAGLRYMSVDTDEYTSNVKGEALFNYAPERQDIWLLPFGVSLKQEVVNDNGWTVTPKVDLSYIWAFGDTDSNMELTIPGVEGSTDNLGFTVMDDGSLLGLVGIEAANGDWTFGVSYSYQKGDYTESEKWYVDAKYSF